MDKQGQGDRAQAAWPDCARAGDVPLIESAMLGLLLAYPVGMLLVPGALDVVFVLLLLLSIPVLVRLRARGRVAGAPWLTGYVVAMCAPLLAEFASQLANWQWGWQPYDRAWRFAAAVPLFLAVRTIRPRRLRAWRFGVLAGALGCGAAVVLAPVAYRFDGRLSGDFLNPIYYGDFAVSLALLALFSQDWRQRDAPWFRALSWLGFVAAVFAAVNTGARGAWLALILLPLLWPLARGSAPSAARALLLAAGFLGVLALLYVAVPEVRLRVGEFFANWAQFRRGQLNTSLGIRLQHWRVALLLFARHPLFGVGTRRLPRLMPELARQGWLTHRAMLLAMGELHSEILAHAAAQGSVGVAATLAVYAAPAARFWSCLRADTGRDVRAEAAMGLAFVGAFFVFGLTVQTFDLDMTISYYALTVAVLLAACSPTAPALPGNFSAKD